MQITPKRLIPEPFSALSAHNCLAVAPLDHLDILEFDGISAAPTPDFVLLSKAAGKTLSVRNLLTGFARCRRVRAPGQARSNGPAVAGRRQAEK